MTATSTYTVLHAAFIVAAHAGNATPLHARVALAVHEAGPDGIQAADLAETLKLDGPSLGVTIAEMHAAGLVVLERRSIALGDVHVTLTEAGRTLARRVLAQVRACSPRRVTFELATDLERRRIRDEDDMAGLV